MEQLPCKAALSKSEERLGSYRRDEHLFGPDWRTAFAGVGLATALSAIFLFLIANASPPSIAAIGSLLWMFVVGAWFLAATTHPGIIARSDEISAEDAAHVAQLRRDVVMPDGRVMPMRWCYHCRVFRPPRAVHCPDCNVCVMRFDHHCPWISQCVGQRNYKYFFAYLWSLTLLCCYTGAFLTVYAFGFWASIDRRALVRQIGGQRDAVLYNGLLIVAVALGVLIGVLCVAPLTAMHTRLLTTDATTSQADRRVYDRTSVLSNCRAVLCDAERLFARLRAQCDAALAEAHAEVRSELERVRVLSDGAGVNAGVGLEGRESGGEGGGEEGEGDVAKDAGLVELRPFGPASAHELAALGRKTSRADEGADADGAAAGASERARAHDDAARAADSGGHRRSPLTSPRLLRASDSQCSFGVGSCGGASTLADDDLPPFELQPVPFSPMAAPSLAPPARAHRRSGGATCLPPARKPAAAAGTSDGALGRASAAGNGARARTWATEGRVAAISEVHVEMPSAAGADDAARIAA